MWNHNNFRKVLKLGGGLGGLYKLQELLPQTKKIKIVGVPVKKKTDLINKV